MIFLDQNMRRVETVATRFMVYIYSDLSRSNNKDKHNLCFDDIVKLFLAELRARGRSTIASRFPVLFFFIKLFYVFLGKVFKMK